jgi:hypothetical protein
MSKTQAEIEQAVKEYMERIENDRYNAKDPLLKITPKDTKKELIIKLITSERTGAPLELAGELLNPAEDIAKRYFYRGYRALNSWQFKNSQYYFNEAANLIREPSFQQRINLFKQLVILLDGVVNISPDRILRSKGRYFKEVLENITKHDLLSTEEKKHYASEASSLYDFACRLANEEDNLARTLQLLVKCTVSLANKEYLAAYIWLFRISLLNKEAFDEISATDEVLQKVLQSLKATIEYESGLVELEEEAPKIASAYDLKMIFIDHLKMIYDLEIEQEMKKHFTFELYKE